jgi:hypothetical protein
MSISDSQKVDLLYKKIAWSVAKTDTNPPKEAYNETNPSPLLIRGDTLWQLSGSIPASIPSTTTNLVQVYKDGVGSWSPTIECTELAVTDNRTWSTGLTDWISQEFGATYFVKVYIDFTGSTTPQTTGTSLQAAGLNDDQWFFDYQAGILNFIGTNLPTAIATGVTGKSIFISGARYIGPKGVTSWSNGLTIGNITISGNTISGNSAGISFGSNICVGNILVTGNITAANAMISSTTTGTLTVNTTTSLVGNTTISSNLTVGNTITAGNVLANNISITTGLFWANGTSFTNFGNTNVTGLLSSYTGNISAGYVVSNSLSGNIITDYISPLTSTTVMFASNGAVGLPVGNVTNRPAGSVGLIRYSTTISGPEYFNGTTWIPVTASVADQIITGDGIHSTFTLSQSANQSSILVSINGTVQQPGIAYTVTGDSITFAEIPLVTDVIDVRFLSSTVTFAASQDIIINSSANVSVTTANTIVDSFYSNTYRSAKYTISSTNTTGCQFSEIALTQYNGSAFINTVNSVNSGSAVINFYANVSNGNINLLAQGISSTNNIKISRIYFTL